MPDLKPPAIPPPQSRWPGRTTVVELMHSRAELVVPWGQPSEIGATRLNTNELPFAVPDAVVSAVATATLQANRYPHPLGEPLRTTLSEHHNVAVENVFVTKGADGALDLCLRAAVRPDGTVATLTPTACPSARRRRTTGLLNSSPRGWRPRTPPDLISPGIRCLAHWRGARSGATTSTFTGYPAAVSESATLRPRPTVVHGR